MESYTANIFHKDITALYICCLLICECGTELFRIHESYSANYLSITDAFEGDCGLSVAKGKFYSDLF